MDRQALEQYIRSTYGVVADYPWMSSPTDAVFRHADSGKWFALMMTLSSSRLGELPARELDVVNLKVDPLLIGSLLCDDGFYAAYHMNKEHWITVALDGRVPRDTLLWLLDMSVRLTASPKRRFADDSSRKECC